MHCEVKLDANLSSYVLHVPLPHAPFNVVSLQGPIQKNIWQNYIGQFVREGALGYPHTQQRPLESSGKLL